MARTKRNRHRDFVLDTEDEFYTRVARIKAEAIEPGQYRYMVKWYHRWNHNCDRYEDYVAKQIAHLTSDWHQGESSAPSAFVNQNFNRPLRGKHKQQIKYALETDAWDGLLLEPYIKQAGWYWF